MKNKNQDAILDKLNKVAKLGELKKNPVKAFNAAKKLTKEVSQDLAAKKATKSVEEDIKEDINEEKPVVIDTNTDVKKPAKKSKGLYAKAASTLMFWSKFFFILLSVAAIAFAVYSYILNQTTEGLIFSVVLAIAVPFISFIVFLLPSSIGQLTAVSERLCEILSEKEFTIRTKIETIAADSIKISAPAQAETRAETVAETPAQAPVQKVATPSAVIAPIPVVVTKKEEAEDEDDESVGQPERIIRRSEQSSEERPKRRVIEPVVDEEDIDEAFDNEKEEEPKQAAQKTETKAHAYDDEKPYHDDPLEVIPEGQVKVLSPNGSINFYQENMRISNPKSCIISDADPDFYHTNLNCMHTWPEKKRNAFKFWRISTRRVAEHYSMAYCPTCFKNDAEQL